MKHAYHESNSEEKAISCAKQNPIESTLLHFLLIAGIAILYETTHWLA